MIAHVITCIRYIVIITSIELFIKGNHVNQAKGGIFLLVCSFKYIEIKTHFDNGSVYIHFCQFVITQLYEITN